jgi:hypothetical protein
MYQVCYHKLRNNHFLKNHKPKKHISDIYLNTNSLFQDLNLFHQKQFQINELNHWMKAFQHIQKNYYHN